MDTETRGWLGKYLSGGRVKLFPFPATCVDLECMRLTTQENWVQGLGVVTHVFNLSTQEAEAARYLKLEASLVYTESSGLHSGTLTKINKQASKQRNEKQALLPLDFRVEGLRLAQVMLLGRVLDSPF